jgi:hypothetical protein
VTDRPPLRSDSSGVGSSSCVGSGFCCRIDD